jgi:Cu-processing system permease protein
MTETMIIASKEFTDGMRNRWIIIVTLLMAGLALILALLGSAPTGTTKFSALAVTIVSLSSLSIFFVPLIALLLSYDSVVAEDDRGTLMLLLAHPVARWHVIAGKFFGHLALLSIAIIAGYGIAGLAIAAVSVQDWADQAWSGFLGLIGSSILLGAVFLAFGLMISARVRERGTAAGMAIGVWLLFVLVYDLGLIALLASGAGEMLNDGLITFLLLANPTDVYRMLNLTGSSETATLSGMAGLAGPGAVPSWALVALLAVWIALPFTAACRFFARRQL